MIKYAQTQAELAKVMPKIDRSTGEVMDGISTTQLANNWMKKDGWPPTTNQGFDVPACREFALSHLEMIEESRSGDALDDLKKREQIKNIRMQRARGQEGLEQDKMQTSKMKGDLWHKNDVLDSWTERNTRVTSTIENWRQGESEKDGTVKGKARIDGLADMLLGMLSEEFDQ